MSASTSRATRLFDDALALVRTHPLEAERPPAITLPAVAARPVQPREGEPAGLPGDLWSLAADLSVGRVSVAELLAGAASRIDAYDRAYGAFEHVAPLAGLGDAIDARRRAGDRRGPLDGIPVSVKDVIDVAGMPTTGSSRAIEPRVAGEDATAVARLRAAGAVIVGKAVTHEFALGVTTPQSRNPWDPDRIPGGSSGGSAISVLTGMALASLGTDTRASIRVPPALCGLVGVKPSAGVVPRDRWLALSWTMDQLAPIGRSVRDVALLLDIVADAGRRFRRLIPGSLAGLRVGCSPALLAGADPGVLGCFDVALASLEDAGAKVGEQADPSADDLALANAAGLVLSRVQAAQYHVERGTNLDACTPEVHDQLSAALTVDAVAYVRALRLRSLLRDRLEAAFDGVDLLAMPTAKIVAPRRDEADEHLMSLSENCIPWSLCDFPALTLPAGTAAGLPVGLQLVAAPGQDDLLIAAAHAAEQVLPRQPAWVPPAGVAHTVGG